MASDTPIRSLTVTSKGQVTLSAASRRQLGIEQGTILLEVVVGNCLVLLPQSAVIGRLRGEAEAAVQSIGMTAEEIMAEAGRSPEERSEKKRAE